jgi:hypothetical protein
VRIQQGLIGDGPPPSTGKHLVIRGVVINVYYPEEETRPGIVGMARGAQKIQAIAVDVLTYGGRNRWWLRGIPVAQPRHALVDHDLWVPRATTQNINTGESLRLPNTNEADEDRLARADPRDLDGDHVLVEMLEGDAQQAFVRYDALPHPRADYRLERASNVVRRERVRGVVQTIDGSGNLTIDTTRANSGGLDAEGKETPALDGNHGRVDLLVNHNAEVNIRGVDDAGADEKFHLRIKDGELLVRLANGQSLVIAGEGAGATLQLGDGLVAAVREDLLDALWGDLASWLATHTHATGVGPSAPPTEALTVPAWNPLIASTKLTFPED